MGSPKTVVDLKEGQEATIVRVEGRGRFRKRLVEMGLVRGTRLRYVGQAPRPPNEARPATVLAAFPNTPPTTG